MATNFLITTTDLEKIVYGVPWFKKLIDQSLECQILLYYTGL
jgi:hypothetical protein